MKTKDSEADLRGERNRNKGSEDVRETNSERKINKETRGEREREKK